MGEIDLLEKIKRQLDETRSLAIEAGGFTLFYMIEMALLETQEMSKKHKSARVARLSIGGLFMMTKPDRSKPGAWRRWLT